MNQDSVQTAINRFYTLLHWQLAAQLPRPGGDHIYSHGGLISGFETQKIKNGWMLSISKGIDYGAYVLGFKDSGQRRTPRGSLETKNFSLLEKTILFVARNFAIPSGGKVVIDI